MSWAQLQSKNRQSEEERIAAQAQLEQQRATLAVGVEAVPGRSGTTQPTSTNSLDERDTTKGSPSRKLPGPEIPAIARPSSTHSRAITFQRSIPLTRAAPLRTTTSVESLPSELTSRKTYIGAEQAVSRGEHGHTFGPNQDHIVSSLRREALSNSNLGDSKIPQSERVNNMRRVRSMGSSLGSLKIDPTLTTPPRNFRQGINRDPVEKLPFLQRPGSETRINSVNKDEIARALEKHGNSRRIDLKGPELEDAVGHLMSNGNHSRETAIAKIKSSSFTGGWDRPPISPDKTKIKGEDSPTKKLVIGRAKSLVSNINWNPETKLRTESRVNQQKGRESYSDPNYNPQGKLIAHESPEGQGVRYSILNQDHVALSKNHDGTKQ